MYVLLLHSVTYVSILSLLEVRNFFPEVSDFVLLEAYVLLLRSVTYVSILSLLEVCAFCHIRFNPEPFRGSQLFSRSLRSRPA